LAEGRLLTGIPVLDEMLGGGLDNKSCSALWSEVEVDASSLALHIMYNRIRCGDRALFVSTAKKPRQILRTLEDLALTVDPSNIEFIDVSTSSSTTLENHGTNSLATIHASTIQSDLVSSISGALAARREQQTLVVIDSFSSLIDRFESPDKTLEFIRNLSEKLREAQATALVVFTEWEYDEKLIEELKKRFCSIIELRGTHEKPVYTMNVIKTGVPESANRLAYFRVHKPGGVKIYLPKIVVTGPFHAGKTSFIHSASKGATSTDRMGTTVAIDFGHVDHEGFFLDLFGTPGQTRFDKLLEKLGRHSVGIIVLLSATDVRSLARVKEQMKLVKSESLPYIVAVNKVNLHGAISLAAVRNLLRIPKKVPVIPLRARDLSEVRPEVPCVLNETDVRNVLDGIVNQILKHESANA
jgi:small GTP-binding protein